MRPGSCSAPMKWRPLPMKLPKTDGYNNYFDFFDSPGQTSDSILLNVGQFYAIEFVHKQGTGSDHFHLFWKPPFAQDTSFQILDGIFLYQYACETACIPAGVACDDGDPNTFDDQYDGNCNCAGTPCSGPGCTNALSYIPYDPCDEKTDRHSTDPSTSWTSCERIPSPNPVRGDSHWAMYDFGEVYVLNDAQVWNYNVVGKTDEGFKNVVIDYSYDGRNWSELDTFVWKKASGLTSYIGFTMPQFDDIRARYILLTPLDNYSGSDCFGLSEILFNATTCPNAGEPCDDGNPLTINDQYNEACYCTGEFTSNNTCDYINGIINDIPIATNKYGAESTITSSGMVKAGSTVLFVAQDYIDLMANFEVERGADFTALIAPCSPPNFKRLKNIFGKSLKKKDSTNKKKKYRKRNAWLKIEDGPDNAFQITYNLPKDKNIWLGIYDGAGSFHGWIINDQPFPKGKYKKKLPTANLATGSYQVSLFMDDFMLTEKLEVVEKK